MPKLPGLQALRGLAALMVLIGHVLAEAEHYLALTLPLAALPWNRGVDIFFVISGFIITLSAQRHISRPLAFLARRLWRVVPLYYLFTTLMLLTLILLPDAAKDTSLDPATLLHSFTFLPHARPDGRIAPLLSLGWTLNYEVFFYVLCTLCLALPRPLPALCMVIALFTLTGFITDPSAVPLQVWTNPLILEFCFGIALAALWQSGWRRPSPTGALLTLTIGLTLLIALDATPLPRFLAAGIPALLITAAATLFCPARALPGIGIGDASYALYLSHRFALRLTTLLVLPLLPATPIGLIAYLTLAVGLCLALALLTHRFIEIPLLRFGAAPSLRKAAT